MPTDPFARLRLAARASRLRVALTLVVAVALAIAPAARGARIKDLTEFQGVRSNPLIGYGLVVGLQATGDSAASLFANRSLAGLLAKLGIVVDPNVVRVTNVAAVMVTAELPPFARVGEAIDVTLSSIGDAENLQGGTLLATPLLGVDGQVYALSQGPVSTGGFAATSAQGDQVQQNHLTVARIPAGALVERELAVPLEGRERVRLLLREKDFVTSSRIAAALNERMGAGTAHAADAGTVELSVPADSQANPVPFLARVEEVDVEPDRAAVVVLNERTGTVVIGAEVRIGAVAISHGNLSIRISTRTAVSQPGPFAEVGATVAFDNSEVVVQEQGSKLGIVQGVTIGELVRTLNAIGASPRDLIAILQAIRAAGALQAELRII
jgi:flagellar P-ring protein precursor FlgI